jgi:hypothetical protein
MTDGVLPLPPSSVATASTSDDAEKEALEKANKDDEGSKTGKLDEKVTTSPVDPSNVQSQKLSHAVSVVDSEKGLPRADEARGEPSEDENIVWWDSDDDPQNPFNWPTWRKLVNCVLISALTFVTPLASCTSKFKRFR